MNTLSRLILLGCTAFSLTIVATTASAHEQTVVEKLIAAQHPCAGLHMRFQSFSLDIDRLKNVKLETADVSLHGNALHLSALGRLACRTSARSAIQGDASAQIKAHATMSLAGCSVSGITIELSDFSGSFAPALSAFAPNIEQSLKRATARKLTGLCRDIHTHTQG